LIFSITRGSIDALNKRGEIDFVGFRAGDTPGPGDKVSVHRDFGTDERAGVPAASLRDEGIGDRIAEFVGMTG
jgi:hypothetical protein